MRKKSIINIKKLIYGVILLLSIITIFNLYSKRITFCAWAISWHIFNTEKIQFHKSLEIKIPSNWWVFKNEPGHIVFAMVPQNENDENIFINLYVGKITEKNFLSEIKKEYLYKCELIKLQTTKTVQIDSVDSFGARYINESNNLISEIWVMPSVGYKIKILEIPEKLYPYAWDFISSNFRIIKN